jgi:hypothetical protein
VTLNLINFVIARFMRATYFRFLKTNWVARMKRAMTVEGDHPASFSRLSQA